ncbi:MAG: 23S rRNA (guanosine(2251)-2'-O)-methyltransferase RlmB [Clostridia bacterium]
MEKPREERPAVDVAPAYINREDELPYMIMGRNAVKEALKSGRSIDRILVTTEQDGSLGELVSLAKDKNIIIRDTDKKKLDELCLPFGHGGKSGNHQGIIALVPGVEYCEISDILNVAKERGEKPFIVLLDGIMDPYNMGSIIRSAECAGAHGVIIPKRRSASITAAVSKTSAGAVEHIKIAKVVNLTGAIDRLKDEGIFIAGADMEGESMYESHLDGAIALVIGGEAEGIGRLIREKCDFMVKIPLHGNIESLNASVAASVLMFEKCRADNSIKPKVASKPKPLPIPETMTVEAVSVADIATTSTPQIQE